LKGPRAAYNRAAAAADDDDDTVGRDGETFVI